MGIFFAITSGGPNEVQFDNDAPLITAFSAVPALVQTLVELNPNPVGA